MAASGRARDLARRLFDGTLSPDEHAELDALLRAAPEAADAFAEASRLEADLSAHFAHRAAVGDEEALLRRMARRPRRWAGSLALAASLLLLALGGLAWWLMQPGPITPILAEGPADMRLADGSRLRLADGARARLGPRRVELFEGEADFDVEPGPAPFEVVTPAGNVRVLGTSFNVLLTDEEDEMDGKTMVLAVAVFTGLVQVEQGGRVYRLGAGDVRAFFQEREGRDSPRVASGVLAEVGDGKITFQGARGREGQTLDVAAGAKVKIDGKPGKLADLPKGAHLVVELDGDGKASAVSAAGATQGMTVKAADKASVTFTVRGRGEDAEKKFDTKDVAVILDGKPGSPDALKGGDSVSVTLTVDGKGIVLIARAGGEREPERGRGTAGSVKSVDAKANTITLAGVRGGEDKTLTLADGAKIAAGDKEIKLADVKPGTQVLLAVDGDGKVTAIRMRGEAGRRPEEGARGTPGVVKGIDAKAKTITLAGGRGAEEKTYTLAEGAKIVAGDVEINFEGIKAGSQVMLAVGRDGKVTSVRLGGAGGRRPEEGRSGGTVKSVDAKAKTVTLGGRGEGKTYTLADDAKIRIGEKEATLDDVKAGMDVIFRLDKDGKVALLGTRGEARRPEGDGRAAGMVKSVDAKANTITLALRGDDEKTYTLAKDAKITAGDKEMKLEDVKEGVGAVLTLDKDGKVTAVQVRMRRERE